jgi:hypothetical protein
VEVEDDAVVAAAAAAPCVALTTWVGFARGPDHGGASASAGAGALSLWRLNEQEHSSQLTSMSTL